MVLLYILYFVIKFLLKSKVIINNISIRSKAISYIIKQKFPGAKAKEYMPLKPHEMTRKFFSKVYKIATSSNYLA